MIILFLLSVALRIAAGAAVDWRNCTSSQFHCLCRKDRDDTKSTLIKIGLDTQIDDCQAIGVQIKSITDDIAIYYLQDIGATGIGPSPKLWLYYGDVQIFGCEFKNGKVEVKFNDDIDKKYIKPFEDQSTYESDNQTVICAIKANSRKVYELAKEAENKNKKNKKIYELKLSTSNGHEIVHKSISSDSSDLFKPPILFTCNPFGFKHNAASTDKHVEPIKRKERDILNCDNYGKLYTMRYEKNGEESQEMLRLYCKDDPNDPESYVYSIVKKEANITTGEPAVEEEAPADPKSYSFYCAAEYRETCEKPAQNCDKNKDECPKFTPGDRGVPATYTCPKKQWIIEDKYYVLEKDPECKKDDMEGAEKGVFYASFAGKVEPIKAEYKCFKEFDCFIWSKPYIPVCQNAKDCGKVNVSNGWLKCEDPKLKLKIGNDIANVTSFKCDTSDGRYYNQSYGSHLPERSKISCFDENLSMVKVAAANMSPTEVYIIIGAVLVAIIAILVSSYCLIMHLVGRRNKLSLKNKKAWKKLSKAEKIDNCKKAYLKVLKADISTADNILHGLNMMVLMLETETDHTECWDEVLAFLMRFQGAMYKMDFPIWHMFSRYMYLQAKKIIDKHGWLATKRITKKNQEGLIRSVAIQLLSFALNDPFNSEAEEMVREGFTQLRFHAINQYPHCGLMWSVIMHARPLVLTNGPDKFAQFSKVRMHEKLKGIACEPKMELPADDVIPEFGSIAKQAAYALGASPDHCYLKEHAAQMLTQLNHPEGAVVPLSFFAGMCESLSRNPLPTIMACCKMFPRFDPSFIAGMLQMAPALEWSKTVRKTTKLVTYYGRSSDATRLTTRFMADDKEIEDHIAEMKMKQQEWEAALDRKLETIRQWFANRTDKEEFKKKPEYITRDAKGNKLDSRVSGDKTAKNAEASQSASKSDPSATASKISESSSHNSDPAAASAAAAAPSSI